LEYKKELHQQAGGAHGSIVDPMDYEPEKCVMIWLHQVPCNYTDEQEKKYDDLKHKFQEWERNGRHTLWFYEKKGNGYCIINKATNQSIVAADPNHIHDMIYTEDHDIDKCLEFQFAGPKGDIVG